MADSDYSFEGEDGSEEEYVGSRASSAKPAPSSRTQGTHKRRTGWPNGCVLQGFGVGGNRRLRNLG